MIDTTAKNKEKGRLFSKVIKTHPVRLTALIYLKQALLKEQYEDCPELIQIAREFGAREVEIRNLLEDPRRNPT